MSNGTQPTHTAGWATSKEQQQHPRGMPTHICRETHFLFFFLTLTNTGAVHPLLLFHMHVHTQPVKFKLTSSGIVSSVSPFFVFPLFPHLLCLFRSTLFLFSPFIRISPLSQASLRALPPLNHYQTAQWEALCQWCNRDTTKRPLCYPDRAQVRSLRGPDPEPVTLCQ